MKLRNHVVVAASIALFLAPGNVFSTLLAVVSCVVGSLIPDLDLRKGHRKYLHNVLVVVVLYILILIFTAEPLVAFYLSVGMLSHIVTDVLTARGVAFLWPFSKQYFSATGLRYNSRVFDMLTILVAATAIMFRLKRLFWEDAVSLPLLNP